MLITVLMYVNYCVMYGDYSKDKTAYVLLRFEVGQNTIDNLNNSLHLLVNLGNNCKRTPWRIKEPVAGLMLSCFENTLLTY